MLCEMSFIPFSSCTIIFKFLFCSSTEHQAVLHGPLPGNCQTFSVSIGHHTHATSCTLSLPSQLAIARAVNYLAVACLLAIESLYYTSFIKNHHQTLLLLQLRPCRRRRRLHRLLLHSRLTCPAARTSGRSDTDGDDETMLLATNITVRVRVHHRRVLLRAGRPR